MVKNIPDKSSDTTIIIGVVFCITLFFMIIVYFVYMNKNPVDCKVSDWKNTGECSLKCGGGTQLRNRTIITQPFDGGNGCPYGRGILGAFPA